MNPNQTKEKDFVSGIKDASHLPAPVQNELFCP
jgi:hypothetical protein